jgi:tRNA threonylcarbamoyladenosine biosynthesis protein TsaE
MTDCFRVIHSLDDSQPPAGLHWSADLPDEAATLQLGAKLASCLRPGTRVYLRGELGSGKTTLIRGLLRGLGIRRAVKSPSYSLLELYVVSRLNLYHFDFYRFIDPSEFADAGFADYFGGKGICLVEWPERAGAALPPPDLEFQFAYKDKGAARAVSVRAFTETGAQCLGILRGPP